MIKMKKSCDKFNIRRNEQISQKLWPFKKKSKGILKSRNMSNKKDRDFDINYFWYPLKEDFDHLYGWLINILPTTVKPKNSEIEFAAVNLFFMEANGNSWRVQKRYEPYFYVMTPFRIEKYQEHPKIRSIERITKLDIGFGSERDAYKLVFANVSDLMEIRKLVKEEPGVELREADVLYYERFCIDHDIHVALWYDVYNDDGEVILKLDKETEAPPQPRVLAFDIECSKEPLQFPNENSDEIMMISYMVDGEGFLVTNRQWFSSDIESFEYSPLEFYCKFTVWNCPNERAMLEKWFDHVNEIKPHIMVTFNGDFFDWPFIDKRASINGISMYQRIGFRNFGNDEYLSNFAPHIDCLRWVRRDSYLPTGSHGLKAVTKEKLQYNPLELDPEDICPLGKEDPQRLANYSVSDAYATYYLYIIYVHPFIFSLTTIIPMNSDDCLRRGTGTLCESLLMDRAYKAGIIFPNKSKGMGISYWNGHLLQNETYIGGNVEALQSGIFRDDIPTPFEINPETYEMIIGRVPEILDFVIDTELKINRENIENIEEIKMQIIEALEKLRDNPKFEATPMIIHLDVAAMYPNIILTNRLQPTAIVNEKICSVCKMRSNECQRKMKWMWRGDFFPATEAESKAVLKQLESENSGTSWFALSVEEQAQKYKERLTEFCSKAYQKTKETRPEERTSIVCMKAHSFYIDTVRSFRDRRYEFKNLLKDWNNKKATAKTPAEREEVKKMIVLYNSLQLAHKALLNSFYGYVMRGGARWRSMEMAGLVTYTGAKIIRKTRKIVQGLGKGLELDTDGIWCAFPPTFPMNYFIKMKDGSKKFFSFPCSMLNQNVDRGFSNFQYHEELPDGSFTVRKENSIFFELDGPYHGMFLPAAKEEKKKLKKRYAVFTSSGHISELKGFEIKRRGEWKMIKMLQSDAFISFMRGNTNEEVYQSVAEVCRQYLMVLKTHGKTIEDEELLMLLSESSTMSKNLAQYGNRKSTSATTARRLAEVLGDNILESKSLKCEYIISRLPATESVAGRAIPVIVFKDDPDTIQMFLRKWCDDPSMTTTDFRDIVDWDYYLQRLHSTLQKILVIPSYLQGITIKNFDVPPPDWVLKQQENKKLEKKQKSIMNFTVSKDLSKEVVRVQKPKIQRDTSELSKYQLKLLEIKKIWRAARKISIERPVVQTAFKDWRVLEIRPSSQPGLVSLFIQTGLRSVQKIDVDIPRVFYINSTRQAADVFQMYMKDRVTEVKTHLPHRFPSDVVTKFTMSENDFIKNKSTFMSSANSAGVHGIYETNVTPLFRTLIKIGTSIQKAKKHHYTLPDIKPTKNQSLPELNGINRIFIYSCFSRKHGGMIGFVPIPPGSETAEAQIFMFYKHEKGREVKASIKNLQEAALQNIENQNVVKLSNYNIHHLQNVREAAAQLQNALAKFGRTESSVVIMNSHLKLEQYLTTLKVTSLHQFPIITLDFHESDDFYDDPKQIFENFTARFIQLSTDLELKMNYSQLLNSPIGNLTGDVCMNSLDLLFARELTSSNYLLWYSESSEPDIGGAYSNSLISMPGDPFSSLTYSKKGAYLSPCIKSRIFHLATSAIIECQSMIDQALPQHNVPEASDFSSKPNLDATTLTAPVFAILSKFLSNLVEKCENQSNILSSMIHHIGTWLASSSSVFYDPALHSVFFHILSTLFDQFVKHFQQAGVNVVFCDQSHIILNVGESSPDNVIIELKSNPLLRWVELSEIERYDKLVWLDEYNYQGVWDKTNYIDVWNICDFLPSYLSTRLVEFFNNMLSGNDGSLKDFFKTVNDDLYSLANNARLAPTIVDNPLRSHHDLSKSDFILFINTIFYAIEGIGDTKLNHRIQSIRNNVLRLMGLGEFEPRAKFVEPSLSLVVPSVLCSHCLNVRNIDVLRDKDILSGNWICVYCQQPYNIRVFERWIYEDFTRRFSAYQTQDVTCTKCSKVQARKLATTCEDGGEYTNKVQPKDLIEYMRIVVIAAKRHKFKYLFESVGQYLKLADPDGSAEILSSFDK
ncbi:DNA polymerase epsilon catalytic subunit A [Tritrichomonas foetus]|uniref:DNA polymerase epsilon catalytic subunit n=1 Tax=Tritrichomonas foetus TaxID=1144522 RepID=A0A1J4JYS2_9EUKA|nr:DNA polymerase epsilon catalytic subunit A [Tritrichomonas foetus]|eukprot:OHT04305.1 DNA polymerase epsilon catalytic subunit A [Tritrichomonas foetus]